MNAARLMIVLGHAFVGWMLCAAAMALGLATMPLLDALIIHALAAPLFFVFVSASYFRRFAFTSGLQTAIIFVLTVLALDFFVVALAINHSLGMFGSLLGTWIPLLLIFTATHFTGLYILNVPRRLLVR